MGIYEYLWVLMAFWVSMDIYGCPWVYIGGYVDL